MDGQTYQILHNCICTNDNILVVGVEYLYKEGSYKCKIILKEVLENREWLRLIVHFTDLDKSLEISHINKNYCYSGMWRLYDWREDIPYASASFDVVLCCDVLEHVQYLPKVISEVSRVLKKGGVLIYDTFNRTLMSKLGAIKILQEWNRWAIMPLGLHIWEMFIRPDEIRTLLKESQLDWREHRGLKPDVSYISLLHYLHQRATGKLSYEEFGKKFALVETKSLKVIYMGYAVRE